MDKIKAISRPADQTTSPPARHNRALWRLRPVGVDLAAVRTFVAVAAAGQFQEAAVDLSITQQAVSKRIAPLEKELGVRLFTRTPRGARLTAEGQAFLPHARDLLQTAEQAVASVRLGNRPLRVDVVGRRLAPASLVRGFHRAHQRTELDVVTLFDAGTAIEAVRSQLAGHRIWMPGLVPGTEWAAFYDKLAAAFGLTIDVTSPDFGTEPLLDTIGASPSLATLVGEQTRITWPAEWDLRRIAVHDPVPVYAHALIWRADSPHPALTALRDYLGPQRYASPGTWAPSW